MISNAKPWIAQNEMYWQCRWDFISIRINKYIKHILERVPPWIYRDMACK